MRSQSVCRSTLRRWIRKSLPCVFTAAALLLLSAASVPAATLYVAPDGDDGNLGTQAQPLRTLQGARDRVRSMDGKGTEEIVVLFKAGDYFVEDTVRFGKEDSGAAGKPVIYKNWGELGSAHLIGGRVLTEWKDEGEGIYSTQLDRDAFALYENGQPAVMARQPNEGYAFFESASDYTHLTFKEADFGRFDYRGAAVRLWAQWIPAKMAIQTVDFGARTIVLEKSYAGNMKDSVWEDPAWAMKKPIRFYIYNCRSFLDQPGEFYMDCAAKQLYYKPRRTPIDQQVIIAPTVDRLVDIDGASDIQFEGLTFQVSNGLLEVTPIMALHWNVKGGLIRLGNARNIVIKYCQLLNSGQNGVVGDGGVEQCTIYGNLMTRLGSGGVHCEGGKNRDNIAENNYIHHVGEGIHIQGSARDVIRHNLIHDVECDGFASTHSERQIVSFNDISRTGLDGSDDDAAGIYVGSTTKGPDGGYSTIDHNLIHDLTYNGFPGYPAAAIYLDMAGTYNCTITNNIIHNIRHKFGIHVRGENHAIRNNIIDFEDQDLLAPFVVTPGSRADIWPGKPPIRNQGYTYEHNVVWSSRKAIFGFINQQPEENTFKLVDNNVYYSPGGDYAFGKMSLDQWHDMGLDRHTKFADPLFVDRAGHDYRLKPESPALALGFREIDTSRIGLKEDFPYRDGGEHGVRSAEAAKTQRRPPGNLIPDAGFEHGAKFWKLEDGGSQFAHEPVRSGASALKVINDFDGHGRAMHNVSQRRIPGIEGGKEYVYSVWVRGENVAGIGQGGKPITELSWLDRDGKRIGRGLYMWAPYGTYPYTCQTIHAQAPASAALCNIHFRSWWDCTGGVTYWDDADLRLRPAVPGQGPLLERFEAEQAAALEQCRVRDQGIGFTGTGYVDLGKAGAAIEWRFQDQGGRRILSLRYAAEAGERSCRLTINGVEQEDLRLVPSGMSTSWATAARVVALKPGDNVIRLQPKPARVGLHLDRLDLLCLR